ncbi:MAG: hypothetical protein ACM3ZF_08320 [Mycobacterium leprae]
MKGLPDPSGPGRVAAWRQPALHLDGSASLARLRAPSTRRTVRSIVVSDPDLAPPTRASLERRLNRWYFACGCEQGSVAVLLTLVAGIVGGLLHGFDGPLVWWRVMLYVVAAALAGKVLGLAYARLRLRSLCRRLEERFAEAGR